MWQQRGNNRSDNQRRSAVRATDQVVVVALTDLILPLIPPRLEDGVLLKRSGAEQRARGDQGTPLPSLSSCLRAVGCGSRFGSGLRLRAVGRRGGIGGGRRPEGTRRAG